MKLTRESMRQYQTPCRAGYDWFAQSFPDGGEYQDILDKLVSEDKVSDAIWLLMTVGLDKTKSKTITGDLTTDMVYSGNLTVTGSIKNSNLYVAGSLTATTIETTDLLRVWGKLTATDIVAGDILSKRDILADSIKATHTVEALGRIMANTIDADFISTLMFIAANTVTHRSGIRGDTSLCGTVTKTT